MSTLLILSGMAMLAIGVLVLGIALISRKAMPVQPEKSDKGENKP